MNKDETREFTALIVPCYNDQHRLDADQFTDFVGRNANYAFIFVDDGSQDRTVDVLTSIQDSVGRDRVWILSLPQNRGKAEAIRQGVLLARSSDFQQNRDLGFIGFLDAELATPLDEIGSLVSMMSDRHEVDLVIANRSVLNGHSLEANAVRNSVRSLISFVAQRTLDLPVSNPQCIVKILRYGRWLESVFGREFTNRSRYDIEILARVRKEFGSVAGSKIFEYPVDVWDVSDRSDLGIHELMKASWQLCRLIFEYRLWQHTASTALDVAHAVHGWVGNKYQVSFVQSTRRASSSHRVPDTYFQRPKIFKPDESINRSENHGKAA